MSLWLQMCKGMFKKFIFHVLLRYYAIISRKVCLHVRSDNCRCQCFSAISHDRLFIRRSVFFLVPSNNKRKLSVNNTTIWMRGGGERSIRAVKSMMTLRYVIMTGFLEKKTMKFFLSKVAAY